MQTRDGMPLIPMRKTSVFTFGMAILVGLVLGSSGQAAGAQNQPSWSTGDYWTYSISGGSDTVTWTVLEQTTITVGATSYPVWHVTTSTTSGNTTITIDTYITTSGVRIAKTSGTVPIFGQFSAVFDPPQPQAVFPLTPGSTWSGTTTVTTTLGSISQTTTQSYSGTVLDERSISVPAGTFTVATIRSPSSGNPYTLNYYSEAVGWLVKTESYNTFGTLTSTQELRSYKYSGGALGTILLIVGILVVVAVVAAIALMMVRRRRAPMMPPGYPPQYPPGPYQPPQQPPQQPPYQGPPPGT